MSQWLVFCVCRITAKGIRKSRRFPACVSRYATSSHKLDRDNPASSDKWE